MKNTSIGYKWLQNLIITCWYGYCGYGKVGCDPKMGGGPPGGYLSNTTSNRLDIGSMTKAHVCVYFYDLVENCSEGMRNVQILFKT